MDDRAQGSQLFALIVGVVLLISMAFVGLLTLYMGGAVLVPFFDATVGSSSAAAEEGFADAAYNVLQIGLGVSLPLLVASPAVYFIWLRLRSDRTPGRR